MMRRLWVRLASVGHFLGGLVAALVAPVSPLLAILVTAVFIIYELDEDWHISDLSYRDIREFLEGMVTGGAILVICKVIGFAWW